MIPNPLSSIVQVEGGHQPHLTWKYRQPFILGDRFRKWVQCLLLCCLLLVLVLGGTTSAQAQTTATPAPTIQPVVSNTSGPLTLFHDDFNTRVDRWHVFNLGAKASLDYNVADGDLQLMATTPNYALWTVPDSDLLLDQATITAQVDWLNGASDAQFGLVFNYHSDNDMLVTTITRAGQLRVGQYVFGVWKDLAPPQTLTLPGSQVNQTNPPNESDQPLILRASITGTGTARQLTVSANDQAASPVPLSNFKPGSFGVFAENGASGTIRIALHNYQINAANKTP